MCSPDWQLGVDHDGSLQARVGSPHSHQLPLHAPNFSSGSPVISVAKRPFQPLSQSKATSQLLPRQQQQERTNQSDCYKTKAHDLESPQGSYDFESRGSSVLSDFILSICVSDSAAMDGYSSEDELSSINCDNSGLRLGGKRTWSKVNCISDASSSGIWDSWSDEGVNDEASPMPLNFSASPPKGVSRLGHTMSPKLFLASVLPPNTLCSTIAWKKPR